MRTYNTFQTFFSLEIIFAHSSSEVSSCFQLLLLVREEDSHRLVSASDKALCQRSTLTVVTNAYASSPRLVVWYDLVDP